MDNSIRNAPTDRWKEPSHFGKTRPPDWKRFGHNWRIGLKACLESGPLVCPPDRREHLPLLLRSASYGGTSRSKLLRPKAAASGRTKGLRPQSGTTKSAVSESPPALPIQATFPFSPLTSPSEPCCRIYPGSATARSPRPRSPDYSDAIDPGHTAPC